MFKKAGGFMTKKKSRIIGIIMFLILFILIIVALNNPQFSFPWSNIITCIMYIAYIIIMVIFLVAPFDKDNKK